MDKPLTKGQRDVLKYLAINAPCSITSGKLAMHNSARSLRQRKLVAISTEGKWTLTAAGRELHAALELAN